MLTETELSPINLIILSKIKVPERRTSSRPFTTVLYFFKISFEDRFEISSNNLLMSWIVKILPSINSSSKEVNPCLIQASVVGVPAMAIAESA